MQINYAHSLFIAALEYLHEEKMGCRCYLAQSKCDTFEMLERSKDETGAEQNTV